MTTLQNVKFVQKLKRIILLFLNLGTMILSQNAVHGNHRTATLGLYQSTSTKSAECIVHTTRQLSEHRSVCTTIFHQ